MRTFLLLLFLSSQLVQSSELRLISVKQPIYLHGSDTDARIQFADVTVATFSADPECLYDSIATPFVPPSSGQYKNPPDINLASCYGVKVFATPDGHDLTVTINASSAKVPEGYPFTVEQD